MDDAISRAAALAVVEKMYKMCEGNLSDYHDLLVACFTDLTPAQRWIPVAEGLPGKYEYVLLTCERNGNLVADFGCLSPYIDGDTSWWIAAHDSKEGWRVCAWMPLPEPARLGD